MYSLNRQHLKNVYYLYIRFKQLNDRKKNMQVTLTGKQVDIGDRLRKHVEENVLATITKYFSSPISCEVFFSKEGEDFITEVIVHPSKNIILKGTGEAVDPYSAFDNANTHIDTRLRRHKKKLKSRKGKSSVSELASESVFAYDYDADDSEEENNAPLTIAEVDANIPVCSVSEAVMYMDLDNEVAIMFRNVINNRISMVYRRKDGNIGWVEPKSE